MFPTTVGRSVIDAMADISAIRSSCACRSCFFQSTAAFFCVCCASCTSASVLPRYWFCMSLNSVYSPFSKSQIESKQAGLYAMTTFSRPESPALTKRFLKSAFEKLRANTSNPCCVMRPSALGSSVNPNFALSTVASDDEGQEAHICAAIGGTPACIIAVVRGKFPIMYLLL